MKKLVITMSIILISLLGYSQVTNVGEFRIANATTAFGVNLPIGTKVYNIDTGDYWVAIVGVASTANLTTATASFTLLNNSGTDDQNAGEVNITDTDGDYTSGTVEGALAEIGDSITDHRTDIDQNASDISDNASAIAGITSNVSTQLSTGTVNGTTYGITSDGSANDVVLVAATTTTAGLLTAAKFGEIEANNAKETNISTILSTGTVDEDSYGITSDGGSDDVILAAATSSAAGVATAAQITKLEGIETGAQVNLTMTTEIFAAAGTPVYVYNLGHTAVTTQGCVVSVNGAVLPATSYTLATGSITISSSKVPLYQYDQIVISYSY